MSDKAAAGVEAVKAAYASLQNHERGDKPRPVNVQALAEALAGRGLHAEDYGARRSRMSVIRAAVDYPQLEVTVGGLVRGGWLQQISYDEALALPVASWGLNRNGRYYLSAGDLARAASAGDG